jgi:hypothetical protein
MSRENVSLSKDGVSATLITFLSGHAASIIVVAFLTVAFYFPVFGVRLSDYKNFTLSTTNKIFIGLLMLALLHPFGILMDTIGWLLLGWLEKPLETFHFSNKTFFTKGARDYLGFEEIKIKYELRKSNFYSIAREKEYFIYARHPDLVTELDFPLGASIFLRNLTVFVLSLAIIYFALVTIKTGLMCLLIAIVFIFFNSCISFFHSLSILKIYSNIPIQQTNSIEL